MPLPWRPPRATTRSRRASRPEAPWCGQPTPVRSSPRLRTRVATRLALPAHPPVDTGPSLLTRCACGGRLERVVDLEVVAWRVVEVVHGNRVAWGSVTGRHVEVHRDRGRLDLWCFGCTCDRLEHGLTDYGGPLRFAAVARIAGPDDDTDVAPEA